MVEQNIDILFLNQMKLFWVRRSRQVSEGNVALFWSPGVNVLINMPAASLGRSRKRGDLVKERDETRWKVVPNVCPFSLDLLC